jgi:ribokinase
VIISLGSTNADTQVRLDRPIVPEGLATGSDLLRTSGGKAANVAVLARKLGAEVQLLSVVGDDDLAEQALKGPRRHGVDISRVGRHGDTNVSLIMVAPDGRKTIVLHEGGAEGWTRQLDTFAKCIDDAVAGSVLVVDLEANVEVVRSIARRAGDRGLRVVLDPSPAHRMTDDLYALCDVITPDHSETAALTGIDASTDTGALHAATVLTMRGAGVACVKLRNGGCAVARDGEARLVLPARRPTVNDQTGVGDAFAGAFAWALHDNRDIDDAAQFAVDVTTFAIEGYGSQESYPSIEQVQAATMA